MGFTTTGGYILGLCRDSSVHTVLLFCPTFRAVPTCRTVMVLAPKDSIRFAVSSQPLDSLPNWLVNGTKVKIKKREEHTMLPRYLVTTGWCIKQHFFRRPQVTLFIKRTVQTLILMMHKKNHQGPRQRGAWHLWWYSALFDNRVDIFNHLWPRHLWISCDWQALSFFNGN